MENLTQGRKSWLWLAAVLLAAIPGRAEILISGKVAVEDGSPLAAAPVRLLPVRSSYASGLDQRAGRSDPASPAETLTGDDGRFELWAPQAAFWEVVAAPEGFVPMVTRLRPLVEEVFLPTVTLKADQPLRVVVCGCRTRPKA